MREEALGSFTSLHENRRIVGWEDPCGSEAMFGPRQGKGGEREWEGRFGEREVTLLFQKWGGIVNVAPSGSVRKLSLAK